MLFAAIYRFASASDSSVLSGESPDIFDVINDAMNVRKSTAAIVLKKFSGRPYSLST